MTATAHPPVRVQELANFVGGEHVPTTSGRSSDVTDPSTGEVYAQAPVSGPADVDAALRAAAGAQQGWRDATPAERSLALLRLADAIESRAEEIVAAECRNTGKPVALTMAEELPPLVDEISSSLARPASCRAPRPGSTWPATPRSSGASRSGCARR